ncbi:MAG TPA: DUF3347 domain-containing protein [Agriterribacter sp.]|nr:DUF3347 domain-containing protein [Chitinophagaceae bacterium]HRP32585.1 DUF3347 domain-containing protein [Agriterribacter sp.]
MMKQVLKFSFPLMAILILSACGNNINPENKTATEHHHDHTAMEHTQAASPASPLLKNDRLNAVYQHYNHLTVALTNGNIADAKIAANAIEAGAKFVDGASGIIASAEKIMIARDIETQRRLYSGMSKAMATLIKKEGMSGGELYIAFCPMALNDQGATWVSENKEIRNPYFGEKMLACGEVKETIR